MKLKSIGIVKGKDEKVIDMMIVLLNVLPSFFSRFLFSLQAARFTRPEQNIKRFAFYWTFAFVSSKKKLVLCSFSILRPRIVVVNEKHKFIFIAKAKFPLWSFSQFEGKQVVRAKKYAQIFWQFLERFLTENITKMESFRLRQQVFTARLSSRER